MTVNLPSCCGATYAASIYLFRRILGFSYQKHTDNKYTMEVLINVLELARTQYASCINFPDVFADLVDETYEPDTIFVLIFTAEAHIVIDVNGDYLFHAIHKFLNKHHIHPSQFTYETGNFKCKEAYLLWRDLYNITAGQIKIKVMSACQYLVNSNNAPAFKNVERPYKYVNLNGAPLLHRVEIINFLHENNFLLYGKNSFHQTHDLLNSELVAQIPLEIDKFGPNNHENDMDHLFNDSYFSIINESVFDRPVHLLTDETADYEQWWREGHITEKTFRAIFHLHPFIMVGASGSLAYIRSLGYKTFDGVIDESYDSIVNPVERMIAVQKEITKLCSYSFDDLRNWYISLEDILQHNQQHYYS